MKKTFSGNNPTHLTENIHSEYFRYTKEYTEKYEKTVVLLQVGAFFEIYGLKSDATGEITQSNIVDVCEICQLNISEKKIVHDKQIIVMAGFRDYTLDKYVVKLTEHGYTVPVFVQEKNGNAITRKLDKIYSLGTYISCETECSQKLQNNIMCIWIETYNQKNIKTTTNKSMKDNIIYGIAVINIFTGKSFLFQHETEFYMNTTTFDELERYVYVYNPCEVIFLSPFTEKEINTIIQFSGITTNYIYRYNNDAKQTSTTSTKLDSITDKIQKCSTQTYIKHILSTTFGNDVYEICSEFYSQPLATQSFCFLLNYVQEHNTDLVRKITMPDFNNVTENMMLANHTLSQLNIIEDNKNADATQCKKKYSSVATLLNKCCTSMGRRQFQYNLTNPTFNEDKLNKEYDITAFFLREIAKDNHIMQRRHLSKIRDINKLCRQLLLKKIYPSSIAGLYDSIKYIKEINAEINVHSKLNNYLLEDIHHHTEKESCYELFFLEYIKNLCDKVLQYIESNLLIDICRKTKSMNTFDENIIQPGVSPKLDDIIKKYKDSEESFNQIFMFFNKLIQENETSSSSSSSSSTTKQTTEYVKIHETEKSGVSLQMTNKRSQILKAILDKKYNSSRDAVAGSILTISTDIKINCKDIRFSRASSSNVEIEIPLLNELTKNMQYSKEIIQTTIIETYLAFLNNLEELHFIDLENLSSYISKYDVLQCKAFIAREYNYCMPIIDSEADKSFIDATDLRHCLIEHIQENEIYVSNNITLGKNEHHNGVLLYGTNAVGKTSLIRSIGIAVIMAQAGLFVPCSQFIYKPYSSIFSRILGNDNIFKGLSTFAVEMAELRVILNLSNKNSLILGDELCSGTESESALSIFMAGIQWLNDNNSSFIFATHFHEIQKYQELKSLSKVESMHMLVSYDREQECLIYDRKLRQGSGPRIYGLEVLKSMYAPPEFIEQAFALRNKYNPETNGELSYNATTYNKHKIRGTCEICKENLGSEIHHIEEQHKANAEGFIGTFHKNHPANLMSICEKCHDEIHKKENNSETLHPITTGKKITRRRKTTNGYAIISSTL